MSGMRIMGFDPGTANTGYSFLIGDPKLRKVAIQEFGVLRTAAVEAHGDTVTVLTVRERIDMIGESIRRKITLLEPTHLAVEDFTEQGKLVGKTYKEMSWLTEHLRMIGREMGVETNIYTNEYWKRVLLKAGRASKEQVKHYVSHRIPGSAALLSRAPTHVWDSAAIGLCCFELRSKEL